MDFNPTGQWLLCVTGDSTLIMIPVYFLLQHRLSAAHQENLAFSQASGVPSRGSDEAPSPKTEVQAKITGFPSLMKLGNTPDKPAPSPRPAPSHPALTNYAQGNQDTRRGSVGSLSDITIIKAITRSKTVAISSVIWWHPADGGDYAIVATNRGRIAFVDLLQQKEMHVIRLQHHISKVEKVESDSYTYLLIFTRKVYYKLLIEQKISDRSSTYETILQPKNRAATSTKEPKSTNVPPPSPFSLYLLQHFSNQEGLRLSVQQTERRGPLISVYNTNTNTLEVFSADLAAKFALFVYQLPTAATHVHLTDQLTFTVGRGDEGSCVYVVSNWNAATSAEPMQWYYKHHKDSVIQEFQLGEGQNVKGIYRRRSPSTSSSHHTALPGFLLWTSDTVYECCQDQPPEVIFYKLVGQFENSEEAESLGKTMGLDVLGLYEAAADRYFDDGHYDQALRLYHQSHVDSAKLVQKYASHGRMEDIIEHLSRKLLSKESLSVNERKSFSDILFKSYLYCCLNPRNKAAALTLEKDFRVFLRENTDYDPGIALSLLRKHGCTADFLLVARCRDLVKRAMNILIHHGCFYINQKNIQLLKECGSSNDLKVCENGVLLRCLPPNLQVKLLLEDLATLPFYNRHITPLLPYLDIDTLMELAVTLDPVGDLGQKLHSLHAHLYSQRLVHPHNSAESELEPDISRPEETMELYIAVLLYIAHYRSQGPDDPSAAGPSPLPYLPPVTTPPAPSTPVRTPTATPTTSRPSTPITIAPSPALKRAVRITAVACGWNHSAAVSDQGQLFTWGRNSYGELGHGQRDDIGVMQPKEVGFLSNHFVTHVAAGAQHTLAVAVAAGGLKTRGVYSWGCGASGQLGHGDRTDRFLPRLVKDIAKMHKIIQVAAGWAHSLFLTEMGVAYSCGHGEQGQLGLGSTKDALIPQKIESLSNITQVACGYCHTVMLTDLGDVYTCGTNLWGQLGQSDSEGACLQAAPTMVPALHGKTLKSVAAGSFHTIALTDLENIYVWGGGAGELLTIDKEDKTKKTRHPSFAQKEAFRAAATPSLLPHLQGERVTGVSCGHHHTAVVTADHMVYVWGIQTDDMQPFSARRSLTQPRTSIGGLGVLEEEWTRPRRVASLDEMQITHVACGEEFTIALSKTGGVYSWGMGSYGQLGLGDARDRYEPELIDFSSLPIPSTPVSSFGISSPVPSPSILHLPLEPAIEDYGQQKLERTLQEQYPKYCPTRILALCKTFQNWPAAAVVFDLLGDWVQALECRLEAIARMCQNKLTKQKATLQGVLAPKETAKIVASEGRQILTTLRSIFDEQHNERKAILILQVLQHWRKRELPTQPIEQFLLKYIEQVGYNLALILQLRGVEAHPFGGIEFSGALYQAVALFCMRRLAPDAASAGNEDMRDALLLKGTGVRDSMLSIPGIGTSAEMNEHALWSQICYTLPTEWDKRAKISLSTSSTSHHERQEMIAFTCDENHIYPRKVFFESILPKFKSLCSAFPAPIQMTVQLMIAERWPYVSL
eukprot:TRINITY_DN1629_c0_g2_i2.p1 TRINITY_DN1629_c0_g2~~TRINITY_DN1629_c0_g2_i2.p1  ORF type:complete len:1654 (-),score=167.20 TRINITY_DN1629_c0_g2_i2:56-4594(-)